MLYLGSNLFIKDNSGAEVVKIINLKVKKTYNSSYLASSCICLAVVKKDKGVLFKKKKFLKRKSVVNIIVSCIKKKLSRKNGFYINFNKNVGIPYEDKNKRLQVFANRVFYPIHKELKKKKIYKHIVLKAKKPL